jgi:hypothetical protein
MNLLTWAKAGILNLSGRDVVLLDREGQEKFLPASARMAKVDRVMSESPMVKGAYCEIETVCTAWGGVQLHGDDGRCTLVVSEDVMQAALVAGMEELSRMVVVDEAGSYVREDGQRVYRRLRRDDRCYLRMEIGDYE